MAKVHNLYIALHRFISLTRMFNALHPVLAIVAFALLSGSSMTNVLLCVIVVFTLAHSLVTVWNDIEDEVIDVSNGRTELRTIRTTAPAVLRVSLIVLIIITIVGLFLIPAQSAALICLFIAISYVYNSRPLYLSRKPIASQLIMLLSYGIIPCVIGVTLVDASPSAFIITLIIFWSLSRWSLSLLKDFKDARGDATHNKRTFLLVYGKRRVVQLSLMLSLIGLIGISIMMAQVSVYAFAALIVAAIMLTVYRLQLFHADKYDTLHAIFQSALKYQLLFDGMVVLWASTLSTSL